VNPEYHLGQNYPNPFNPMTSIDFEIPEDGHVDIGIYDVSGRLVRTLVRGYRTAGRYAEVWDGRTDSGKKASSGVYFYQLTTKGFNEKKRMVLLK
jgi:flagellar hook assembly protein FlgD